MTRDKGEKKYWRNVPKIRKQGKSKIPSNNLEIVATGGNPIKHIKSFFRLNFF